MRKMISALMVCTILMGCVTLTNPDGTPSDTAILIEGGLIGIAFYETKDEQFPDDSERATIALEKANGYIQAMYGKKYTIHGLAHGLIDSQIAAVENIQLRKYIYIARIMLDIEGHFTGIPLLDAILQADEMMDTL